MPKAAKSDFGPTSNGGNSSSHRRGKTRGGRPPKAYGSDQRSETFRVWGKTPNAGVDKSSLTELFTMQNRLKADLRRQARLARLDVAEVRSAEAERLRMVNEAILHESSSVLGVKNPFSERDLTDAQKFSEDMVKRQGKRSHGGEPWSKPTRPSLFTVRKHRKTVTNYESRNWSPPLEELFTLRGPLARDFHRAKVRGYSGGPQAWLRGPKAAVLIEKLLRKGLTFPQPGRLSVFAESSPLHYVVTSHTGLQEHIFRRGFTREKIRSEVTNFVILGRQARSVKRLNVSDWPSHGEGRSWPTFPTLNESWEMMMRGKVPHHHNLDPVRADIISPNKIPTRQVKPGARARCVSKLVLGIRADVEVPRKFLDYFNYRWGFLILIRRKLLPDELTKWLARQWKEDITRMFLVYPIRYNDALRRMPSRDQWALRGFRLSVSVQHMPTDCARKRKFRLPKSKRPVGNPSLDTGSPESMTQGDPTSLSDESDSGVRLS